MPSVPTFKQLVDRSNDNLWMTRESLGVLENVLATLPDTKYVGDTSIVELVDPTHGYNIGWAIVNPDADDWVWVPAKSTDLTVDNREDLG